MYDLEPKKNYLRNQVICAAVVALFFWIGVLMD